MQITTDGWNNLDINAVTRSAMINNENVLSIWVLKIGIKGLNLTQGRSSIITFFE